jgi:DNA anti-recombination protein RmuC
VLFFQFARLTKAVVGAVDASSDNINRTQTALNLQQDLKDGAKLTGDEARTLLEKIEEIVTLLQHRQGSFQQPVTEYQNKMNKLITNRDSISDQVRTVTNSQTVSTQLSFCVSAYTGWEIISG